MPGCARGGLTRFYGHRGAEGSRSRKTGRASVAAAPWEDDNGTAARLTPATTPAPHGMNRGIDRRPVRGGPGLLARPGSRLPAGPRPAQPDLPRVIRLLEWRARRWPQGHGDALGLPGGDSGEGAGRAVRRSRAVEWALADAEPRRWVRKAPGSGTTLRPVTCTATSRRRRGPGTGTGGAHRPAGELRLPGYDDRDGRHCRAWALPGRDHPARTRFGIGGAEVGPVLEALSSPGSAGRR